MLLFFTSKVLGIFADIRFAGMVVEGRIVGVKGGACVPHSVFDFP